MKESNPDRFTTDRLKPVQNILKQFTNIESTTSTDFRQAFLHRAKQLTKGEDITENSAFDRTTLVSYADKCSRFAYKVTDQDVEKMRQDGVSEEEIIDVTLASALGTSVARFEKGLSLLWEEEERG